MYVCYSINVMKCPKCNSSHINKIGSRITVKGKKARLQCQDCGKTFYAETKKIEGGE